MYTNVPVYFSIHHGQEKYAKSNRKGLLRNAIGNIG